MSEMVERAAQAAYAKWIEGVESLEPPWEQMPQDFRDRMIEAQHAAIASMREPTKAVLDSGRDVMTDYDDAEVCWHEMIDEALR